MPAARCQTAKSSTVVISGIPCSLQIIRKMSSTVVLRSIGNLCSNPSNAMTVANTSVGGAAVSKGGGTDAVPSEGEGDEVVAGDGATTAK